MALDLDGIDNVADGSKINDGVWVHLTSVDPETNQPVPRFLLGDPTKPQRVKVRSNRCKAIQIAEDRQRREMFVAMRVTRKEKQNEVMAAKAAVPMDERFGYLLAAVENLSSKVPGVQTVSMEDAKAIYNGDRDRHGWWIDQVFETAAADSNYLSDAEIAELEKRREEFEKNGETTTQTP